MKHFLPSTALAVMIGLGSLTLGGNAVAANKWDSLQPDRDEIVASLNVVELLKRHHYSKPPLDDARSVIIYDSYIKLLDPARSYFTAADIAEFDKWKTQFDDFLKSGNLDPGFTIYKRYLDRVKQRLDFALAELNKGEISEYRVQPEDFGIKSQSLIGPNVEDAQGSLALIRDALGRRKTENGQKAADMIVLNAGAALYAADVASSLKQGVEIAHDALHTGLARDKFEELVSFTVVFKQESSQ